MKEENYDQKMYSAKRAYVLMKRSFSKDAQLAWYFKHLNENLTVIRDKKNKKDDNCEVLSLTPMDNSPRNQTNLILSDETQVTFICQEYYLVFLLHLNPSMASVEISSPTPGIMFDKVFSTLKNVLKSLAKSFSTPGSTQSILITPDINISIIIWTSVVKCHIKQVLLHGFHLTKNNVNTVLNNIEKELISFENNLAATYKSNVNSFENVHDSSFENTDTDAMTQISFGNERGDESLKDDIVPSEKSLILMLRHCLLLLKMMQQNSQLGIVILTDGFIGISDSSFLDSILQQMRLDHVAISFVQIGHCPASYKEYNNRCFGSVANTELMQFISMATRGFYFDSPPKATQTGDPTLNNIQKGLLARDLFFTNDDETLDGVSDATEDIWLPGDLTFVNLHQASLPLPIHVIVASRLKEGYLLKTVRFTQNDQDETVIEIGMNLPWRWDVHVHYHASCLWPLVVGSHKKQTQVKVMVEAPSLLMNDVSNLQHHKNNRLIYPKAMLSNFTLFFKRISQTDKLLSHLYQFNYKEPHYNLAPEIKEFTPLLVESFSSSSLPLHHDLLVNSKLANSKLTEFIQFWNLKCLLEVSNWSKWFDPHRIDLLLKHDESFNRKPCTYLNNNYINATSRLSNGDTSMHNLTNDYGEEENYPKNNSNNSLNSLGHQNNKSSFKQKINNNVNNQTQNSLDTSENVNILFETTSSAKEFYKWLKEMTTFVIVDKLLYIGFIYNKASESYPSSFFIVRVDAKLPYIILHIAFIGASAILQAEKIDKLKIELLKRKVSFKTSPVYIKPLPSSKKFFPKLSKKISQNHMSDLAKQAPTGEILVEKGEGMESSLCCYMCHKPIDRIQINYKQLPKDFLRTDLVVPSERFRGHMNASKLAFNVMFTTSNLLMHKRWIWNLADSTSGLPQVTDSVMDKVVYNIVHMRLEEGFHFITSLPGSLKLIAEFKMRLDDGKYSSCVVQFIMFAPKACSQQEKSGENGKGSLQLVTECWVEPQAGVVAEGSVKTNGFSRKEYCEIPDVIYALDRECISAFVTMHNLITLCKSNQDFYSDGNHVSASQPSEQLQHQNSSRSSLCYSFRTASPQQIENNLNNLEHWINHIPFPFDLLTLTSRCQQVELVFSIFANVVQEKGNNSTESRQFSLTEEPSDKDLYAKSHDILCPNTLLFLLLNTLLKNDHDKELKLSSNDCVGLLESLKKRERDPAIKPLPFLSNDEIHSTTQDRMSSESCENQTKDQDFPKTQGASPSLNHSPPSSLTECRSKRTHISSIGRSTAIDDGHFVSEWKCYLKLVTPEPKKSLAMVSQTSSRSILLSSKYRHQQKQHSSHSQKQKKSQQNQKKCEKEEHNLLITLVPSTYKDLLKLLNTEENDSLSATKINKPPTKSVAFSAELEGIEEHEVSNYHITPPLTAPADLQPSKRCPLLSRSSSSQETATNDHPPCHPCDHLTPWPFHVLPIYVYNCSTATFCDLMLNLKINQKIPDLYNDFTFEDDVSSSLSKSSDLSQSPKRVSVDGSNRKISDCESTCSKERWRRASAALYKNQDELRKHSNTVSETYLRCFLIAMYESLRNGRQVLRQDVRATVKSICEESIPLQMDITDFLQTSCSFFNFSPKKDTAENINQAEETIDNDNEESVQEEKTAQHLLEEHDCTDELHNQVKKRFLQVISQYFKPISSQPDYLFYCYSQDLNEHELVGDDTDDSSQNTDQRTVIFKKAESSKVPQQFEMEADERCTSSSFQGIQAAWPNQNNLKSFSHSPKTSEAKQPNTSTSTADTILLRASNITPLFLQLSCSLSLNNEHKFPAFSVETIPTCICEFKNFLKCSLSRTNLSQNIPLDLSKLRVQLELSCLSLTPVEVESVSKRRRRYSRLNSMNSSQQSNQDDNDYASDADDDNDYSSSRLNEREDDDEDDGNDSDDDDEDDDRDGSLSTDKNTTVSTYSEHKSASFAESDAYKGRYRSQCIGHLPKSQQRSVLTCEKLMKWVLKDEMISTLRNIHPVTEDILQQVVEHVKCSRNQHDMCRLKTIPLKFVFGSDRSYTYFITEFEKNRVFRMPMVRVGSYYYICRPLQASKKSDSHRERNITLTLQDNNESLPLNTNDIFMPELETVSGSLASPMYNDNASIISKESVQFTSSPRYPKLCSQNFMALSYKGDKYMRTIEYYMDENKRVRPTSGPAGFDGSTNCITPLISDNKSEKEADKHRESSVKEKTCSKSIKRAQSSTTFDKTSRHSFDSRQKNLSGRDTPSSALDTSSITTGGYDADSSEADEETASAYDQVPVTRKPLVPEFWMVLKVTRQKNSDPESANQVDIYFHSRESMHSEAGRRYLKVLEQLSKDIDRICHRVNQKFLLDDLYTNLRFHPLLMREENDASNDDATQDDSSKEARREDSDEEERNCLASSWQFKPGHFECHPVWEINFNIHQRLCTMKKFSGLSILKSYLNEFKVKNRPNVFVLKDTSNVFYTKFSKSNHNSKSFHNSENSFDDPKSLSTLSQISASIDNDKAGRSKKVEPTRHPSTPWTSDHEASVHTSSFSKHLPQNHQRIDEKITFTLYGINKPDKKTCNDLLDGMQKRLNEYVLDAITLVISRNSPLYSQDVKFIQKPASQPTKIFHYHFPKTALLHQFAFGYYLRQILQSFFILPKYIDIGFQTYNRFNDADSCFSASSNTMFTSSPPIVPIPPPPPRQQNNSTCNLQQPSSSSSSQSFAPTSNFSQQPSKHQSSFSSHQSQSSISPQDIYLYVRPFQDADKGIACINMAFIDGKGHPLHLLGSPKPSHVNSFEFVDKSFFSHILQVDRYVFDAQSKSPGPTSLIEFAIWECGNLDFVRLEEMLTQCIQFALHDLVMEYHLLTSPISSLPPNYSKGLNSPLHSAPVSPTLGINSESSFTNPKTPKLPPSSINTLFEYMSHSSKANTVVFNTCLNQSGEESSRGAEVIELDEQLSKKLVLYEQGLKGFLSKTFEHLIPAWVDFCKRTFCTLELPSINRHEYTLKTLPSVDMLLREIPKIFKDVVSDMDLAFFKQNTGSEPFYEPFSIKVLQIFREQKSFDDSFKSEVNNNESKSKLRPSNYIIIGRNINQWRNSIDYKFVLKDSYSHQSHSTTTTPILPTTNLPVHSSSMSSVQSPKLVNFNKKFTCQKFNAFEENQNGEKIFVPRQNFIQIFISHKKVTLFMYNIGQEFAGNIEKRISGQVNWHNERAILLHNIALQKMGLFNHCFSEQTQSPGEFEQLIRNVTKPYSISMKMRNKSGGSGGKAGLGLPQNQMVSLQTLSNPYSNIEGLYRNNKPLHPMKKNSQSTYKIDMLKKHGMQAIKMKDDEKLECDRKVRMQKLIQICEHRSSSPITLDKSDLEFLKKSCRVLHQVMSPLLFSPLWQRESTLCADSSFFLPTHTKTTTNKTPSEGSNAAVAPTVSNSGSSQAEKAVSRNSSESSGRSKKSDVAEGRVKRLHGSNATDNPPPPPLVNSSGISLDQLMKQPAKTQRTRSMQKNNEEVTFVEPEWQKRLCNHMSKEYVNYLTPCSFSRIAIKSSNGSNSSTETPDSLHNISYLHKSLSGGMLLVEIGFLPSHFYVIIYAFQIPSSTQHPPLNPQHRLMFSDELDKIKEMLRFNSFCHDFHLRIIQSFIQSPQSSLLPPKYPVSSFLKEVVYYFPYEPMFSWNYVHEECMTLPCSPNTSTQLFEYMTQHLDNMIAVNMNFRIGFSDNATSSREDALLCMLEPTDMECGEFHCQQSLFKNFQLGLFLVLDSPTTQPLPRVPNQPPILNQEQKEQMHLKFWVVLTNPFQIHPKNTRHQISSTYHSSDLSRPTVIFEGNANPSRVNFNLFEKSLSEKFQREQMDYLGYSNKHQLPLHTILQPVVSITRNRIEKMVEGMRCCCHRDHLWMRLLVSDEDSRRKRKTGEVEESKDPAMAKLTCTELQKLLDLVYKKDLTEIDPRLKQLLNLPLDALNGLMKNLFEKYKTDSRFFQKSLSIECNLQYLVILNPKYLDAFFMLKIDNKLKITEFMLVIKENDASHTDPPSAVNQHLQCVISSCLYHLWASLFA